MMEAQVFADYSCGGGVLAIAKIEISVENTMAGL
jgi:hypothetical protein